MFGQSVDETRELFAAETWYDTTEAIAQGVATGTAFAEDEKDPEPDMTAQAGGGSNTPRVDLRALQALAVIGGTRR